jgi:tRNA-5-methyluridine54 2-sulfurtransferase
VKCKRCREKAEVALRAHNAAFCRPCYLQYFRRQVERAIAGADMFTHDDRLLLAVSGGKDSLALWDVLHGLEYDVTGFYLAQGIGDYSALSRDKVEAFAASRGLALQIGDLPTEGPGLAVPDVAQLTRRSACSACGTLKRHAFDRAAYAGSFDVLVTGHNLDDEAARLLGNVLRWQTDHLARQHPVLQPTHARFVRKVKPLYLLSEYETAVYAFMRGIDYVVDECPNAAGATQLLYKDALNRLEAESPGTKQSFVREFVRRVQPVLARPADAERGDPNGCARCGMPAWGELCGFCRLVDEVTSKRARRTSPPPAA